MIKQIKTLCFVFLTCYLWGQQNDAFRFNYDNQFINNPAATATFLDLSATAYHQKTFTGINRAPASSLIALQIPFRDWNMSGGAALQSQSIGLLTDTRFNLSYAYKIRLNRSRSQLAIGLSAELIQLRIDGSNIESTVDLSDPTLSTVVGNDLTSNFGVGVVYSSTDRLTDRDDLVYQFGLAMSRTLRNESEINNFSFRQTRQFSAFTTVRYNLLPDLRLSGLLEAQYEAIDLVDVRLNVSALWYDIAHTGISYDAQRLVSVEAGMQIEDYIGLDRGRLLVAVSGTLPIGSSNIAINQGYALRIFYSFDVSNF